MKRSEFLRYATATVAVTLAGCTQASQPSLGSATITATPPPTPIAQQTEVPTADPRPVESPTPRPAELPTEYELARSYALALADLPSGFSTQRGTNGWETNEQAAQQGPNSAEDLADYERLGRVIGYWVVYLKQGYPAAGPARQWFSMVDSGAAVFRTEEGAHTRFQTIVESAKQDNRMTSLPMPALGDESAAAKHTSTIEVNGRAVDWTAYSIRIRKDNVTISLDGEGLSSAVSFDELERLARTVLGQPRQNLPCPP